MSDEGPGASASLQLAARLHDAIVENTRETRACREEVHALRMLLSSGQPLAKPGGLSQVLERLVAEPGRLEGLAEQITGRPFHGATRRRRRG